MKHAILGAGAIGGLIGTALGYLGDDVTMIVRSEKLSDHPRTISLERPSGTITASVKAVSRLADVVDVLWIATKTYQMDTALELVEATPSIVVPLLNGWITSPCSARDSVSVAWFRRPLPWKLGNRVHLRPDSPRVRAASFLLRKAEMKSKCRIVQEPARR